MKWIVTGACGFIGTNFVEHALEHGDEVVGIDNISRPRVHHNLGFLRDELGVRIEIGDIRNRDFIHSVFEGNRDAQAVVHLAGQVSYLAGESDPLTDFEVNAMGTAIVCSGAAKYLEKVPLIFSSSNKVYGDLAHLPISEGVTRFTIPSRSGGLSAQEPVAPIGAYATSKAAAEMVVRSWTDRGEIRGVSFRQSSVYGGRQFPTSDQGWVAYFAEVFASDSPYTISGNGKQVRDLLHVRDLCEAYRRTATMALTLHGQSWNVGGGPSNSLSILELTKLLRDTTGNSPQLQWLDKRPNDQRVFVSDNVDLLEYTGWAPQVGIEKGLSEMLAWSRQLKRLQEGAK